MQLNTATVMEGDQFVGQFTVDTAPNDFIRRLVIDALENGEARTLDSDGCEVTAVADEEE